MGLALPPTFVRVDPPPLPMVLNISKILTTSLFCRYQSSFIVVIRRINQLQDSTYSSRGVKVSQLRLLKLDACVEFHVTPLHCRPHAFD